MADAPGTHSVCVCTTYQNVELLISAADLNHSPFKSDKFAQLATETACLRNVISALGLVQFQDILDEYFEDCDAHDETELFQWITTGRTEMISQKMPRESFINQILQNLTN